MMASQSTTVPVRVSVLGGSGYVGGELVRLLLSHPAVDLSQVTSERLRRNPLCAAHPNLRSLSALRFCGLEELEPAEVMFSCLPHGELAERWPGLASLAPRWIDLSSDFRLPSAQPNIPFRYSLPDFDHVDPLGISHWAVPGCMAHAAILATIPLARAGLIRPELVIDAKTGSSGGGNAPRTSAHHPERAGALHCYAPTGHRHSVEIEWALQAHAGLESPNVHFSATSVANVRGILVTAHCFSAGSVEDHDGLRAFASAFRSRPFIRLITPKIGDVCPHPDPKILAGTNWCDLSVECDAARGRIVVNAAIDNLGRGAAGTAVQTLNRMLGLTESAGLDFPGLHPI